VREGGVRSGKVILFLELYISRGFWDRTALDGGCCAALIRWPRAIAKSNNKGKDRSRFPDGNGRQKGKGKSNGKGRGKYKCKGKN
jgi:hypothetical protein